MTEGESSSVVLSDEYEKLKNAGYEHVEGTPVPQPIRRPEFSLSELRNAIPKHCFERSLCKSFGYVALDLAIISSLFYCANIVLEKGSLSSFAQLVGYPIYWFLQGSVLFGIWTIGHECGHSAFSKNELISDIVGFILHSGLLVPYFSFKITHRKHHSNTGSCENDLGYIPLTESEIAPIWSETLENSPFYSLYRLSVTLLFGWMPGYLFYSAWGPKKYENQSHFNPNAAFFLPKERPLVVLSNVGVLLAMVIIGYFIYICGFLIVMRLYFLPYLIMNVYIVTITYLQHTDTYVPHLREGEWNWLRGSLCTVDRSYGKFLDTIVHHLTDTHICHHLFSKMPFYHCAEATEAMKPILGKYYLKDTTPFYLALWRVVTHCRYVQDDGKIVFYKRKLNKEELVNN